MSRKRSVILGCLAAAAAALVAVAIATAAGAAPEGVQLRLPATGAKTGALSRVDSQLQQLLSDQRAGRDVLRAGRAAQLRVSPGKRVMVDVYAKGGLAEAAAGLRAAGMEVRATTDRPPFRIAEGWLPIAALPSVARLGATRAVLGVTGFSLSAGSVQSQGDAAHRGPQARALGPNGRGVKVGVISDSINQSGGGVAGSQSSGDLPGSIQILSEAAGGSDEGRAMAEIAYDTAPGITQMAFATGAGGPVEKANAMNALVASGARVIADDISWFSEPFFQDGVIAQAADAAKAHGVAYLEAAGNLRRQSYESGFHASPCGSAACHDFGGGDQVQYVETVPAGGSIRVFLQWDDQWGRASTDLDMGLLTATGAALPGSAPSQGTSDNIATGIPLEAASWTNTTGSPVAVGLVMQRFAGTRAPFMKYLADDNFTFNGFSIGEHNTNSPAIAQDAAGARGALAVGAVRYNQPGLNSPEPFSSRGPLLRLFDRNGNRLARPDVRQKPDIAAADGVSTTVFSSFFGTSAAAPSAAGVAALILSAKSSIRVDDAYAILRSRPNTIDCLVAGNPDPDCGSGFVLANAAVRMALDPTPPTIGLHRTKPNGRHGWYVRKKKIQVSWSVSDSGSPVTAISGCGRRTITKDTRSTKITCTAHSAGGTSSKTVEIKRDSKNPRLTRVSVSSRTFAVRVHGKASSARRKGTRLRFRLSEKATVTVKVQKRVRRRWRTVRTFKVKGKKGRNGVVFSGRIKRRHRRPSKLGRGRYRFQLQAADPAGNRSKAARVRFRIVR